MTLPDETGLAWLAQYAARHTIAAIARDGAVAADESGQGDIPSRFRRHGASFVTLQQAGCLRGCIGTLVAHRALFEDVAANAHGAALSDPRFPALTAADLDRTDIAVSVLSAPQVLHCGDRATLLAALRPGHDGLVVSCGPRRATLLPAVWTSLSDPARFVDALLAKAGLDETVAFAELTFSRYHTAASAPLRLQAVARG